MRLFLNSNLDSNGTNYDKMKRKRINFFLHYAQQPQRLYVAEIAPLNMETCVSVREYFANLMQIIEKF